MKLLPLLALAAMSPQASWAHPPDAGRLAGLLANDERRAVFAAVVLGAGTLAAVVSATPGVVSFDDLGAYKYLLRVSQDGRTAILLAGRSGAAFAAERSIKLQAHTNLTARPDLHSLSAPMIEPLRSLSR